MRYMDTPMFLDVSSVISSYSLSGSVAVNSTVNTNGRAIDSVGIGGSGTYSNSPTITYTPLTGNKFLRSMLDPVPPSSILYLLQSGYPADFLLELGVNSLNDLHNRSSHGGDVQKADPEFLRLAELFREIQISGAIGMRVDEGPSNTVTASLYFRSERVSPEVMAEIREAKELLRLPDDKSSFEVIYSPVRAGNNQLAVDSRSVLQMMGALATFVDIPPYEVEEGRTIAVPDTSLWSHPLLHVHCGNSRPDDDFVAVQYRDHWFWIEDRDWWSKRTFSTILFLFTLADTGSPDRTPVVTIPAR
jgi:hypothetical protein